MATTSPEIPESSANTPNAETKPTQEKDNAQKLIDLANSIL